MLHLGDGSKKLIFVFSTERKRFIRTTRKNGHNRSLRQSDAFDHNLPVDDGAGSYLHKPMVLGRQRNTNCAEAS